jgi:uncharacterized protein (DUF427 family)
MQTERAADYPRPPRIEPDARRVRVLHGGVVVIDTVRALRVLETWSPPTFYLPVADLSPGVRLVRSAGASSFCEWKGQATYWSLAIDDEVVVRDAAWSYESPTPAFASIVDHVAFYASRVDECWVGDELARPQAGRFYGGWITSEVEGPFKGDPGTERW